MSLERYRIPRAQLKAEIAEKTLDFQAFYKAREVIRGRVLEVRDSPNQLTPLPTWSGTDAVLGSLDLAIHAMEHTLHELHVMMLQSAPERPPLTVVKDEPNE